MAEKSISEQIKILKKDIQRLQKELGREGLKITVDVENEQAVKDLQAQQRALNEEVAAMNNEYREFRGILDGIREGLGKNQDIVKNTTSEYNKLDKVFRKLSEQQEYGNRLSDIQLEKQQSILDSSIREIKANGDNLQKEQKSLGLFSKQLQLIQEREGVEEETKKKISDIIMGKAEINDLQKEERELLQSTLNEANRKLDKTKQLKDSELEILSAHQLNYREERRAVKLMEQAIDKRKASNEALGLSGILLKGLNATGGEFAKALNLDQVQKDMEKFSDEMVEVDKKTGDVIARASKFSVLMEGVSSATKNLGKALSDPLVLFNFLLGAANATSTRITGIQNQLGASYGEASRLNFEMQMTAAASGNLFITTEKLAKSFATVTDEIGMSAEILGMDTLVTVTKLTEELGMSGKEATNLAVMARLQGKNTEDVLKNTVEQVNAVNKTNKGAINAKAVLSDIANASATISARLGESPEKLARAATEARQLGLSLDGVNQIAESLLNFESSIENELKAELLTGKELNLEKARELALTGDLEGLSKEIGKQDAIRNAFANKNVIAQKSLADALGISVDQLAEMNRTQELARLGAEGFRDAYGEQAYEAMLAKDAQEKFNATIDKVKAILGGIGTALAPFLDALMFIVDNPIAPYLISAFIAFKAIKAMKIGSEFGKMATGAKDTMKAMSGIASKAKDLVLGKKIGGQFLPGGGRAPAGARAGFMGKGGIGGSVKGVFKKGGVKNLVKTTFGGKDKDITKDLEEKGKNITKTSDATQGIQASAGEKIKEFLKGLSEGLKSMASLEVVKGALALIPASIGLTLMIPGAVGAMLLSNIDGPKLEEALKGLSEGLKALDPMAMFGALALIPASIGLTAMIPGAVGALLISQIDGEGFKNGLQGIADGLKTLDGKAMFGALALIPISLGLTAMIPGAVGALLISQIDGEGFKNGLQGIADGLKSIDGKAMLGGLALIPIALGLAAMLPGVVAILAIAAVGPLAEAGFTGLGRGLMFFGDNFGKIVQGSLALGIAGLAFAGSFALALLMIKDVDPVQMIAFAGSLAIFGATAALLGNFSSQIIQGAIGLGILGLALIPAAFAFSLLQGLDVGAMVAFSIALPLLALAAAGLGFIAPFILAGAGALAVLGLALIPAGMAFSMLQGIDTDMILGFAQGVGALAISVAALGFAAPFIMMGAIALNILGLALIPAAESFSKLKGVDPAFITSFAEGIGKLAITMAGLGILAIPIMAGAIALSIMSAALLPLSFAIKSLQNAGLNELSTSLQALSLTGPGLLGVGAGLMSIAGGLAAISLTGLLAMPVLGALTALGAVTGGLGSLFGDDAEEPSVSSDTEMLSEKLDQVNNNILKLISVVEAGGDVVMDGAVVGKTISLTTSGIG